MKITDLARHDLPPAVLDLWRQREGETLLPLQELAVKQYGLFGAKNLLIQAPTSSGKTFIGEMAALQTALRRKKVVYLAPLKALAEEKYADFEQKYHPYGLEVIISTRDHRAFDAQLESGGFSIAVVVYEKLAQLLVRRPERFEEVHLVIADELEILSDPDRGAPIELLLTRVLASRARLIGLSAVIGKADKLAEWMGADLLTYDRRPVELRYGVLHNGVFRYRTYNGLSEGEEQLVDAASESPGEILAENLCAFVDRCEPCLVFVKAKHESRRAAELLAGRIGQPPAAEALAALRALEPTHCREALLDTLQCGVAFHNADLSPQERRIVEEAFRNGEIKVMVSTSTLAMGMNLPARNVFISSDKWRYDNRFGMPWKTPILRAEFENMGGRGGRYGAGYEYGRAILIAATPFDQETLWRRYIEGEREQVDPQLGQTSLEDHVLRLIASRSCHTEEDVLAFFDKTLTGRWVWAETLSLDELRFRVRAAVNRCLDAGMASKGADGQLDATPFGQTVAAKGISIATAREMEAWLIESETRPWCDTDLILAAALTPDGRMVQISLTAREYEEADYLGALKRLTIEEPIGPDVPLNRFRNCTLMPFFEEVRAIKTALFLAEWIEDASLYSLEERYQTLAGQILSAAAQVSWLLDAAAAIAMAFGAPNHFTARIARLAARVQHGLSEEALPLARAGVPELDREGILALAAHGYHRPEALDAASADLLAQWIPRAVAHALKEWAAVRIAAERPEPDGAETVPQPVLVVDDRQPGQILVDGRSVPLQDKQYRLIRVLAAAPSECVAYDAIYEGVWGETIVEPNQMHFQKRKLLARIAKAAPHRMDLVKTVPKRGFVLDLAPHEVVLHAHQTAQAV